jgi:type II secretory pathway pseudopilin PulG
MIKHPAILKRPRPGAFTLVEALLVVTMVGIVLPIALYCISTSQRAADLVRRRAQAMEIATNEMNLLVATQTWQNDQQGDQDADSGTFHWATHTQNWIDDPVDSTVHELHVDVTWVDGQRTRTVSVVTLVYDGGTTQ